MAVVSPVQAATPIATLQSSFTRPNTAKSDSSDQGKSGTMVTQSRTVGENNSTAAARTFAISELLENMSINLSPEEILATRLVDKSFHGVIQHLKETRKNFNVEKLKATLMSDEVTKANYPFKVMKIGTLEREA